MLKHVVKHNQRKGVLLYRQVPDEGHMCLLIYSDVLPKMIHDEVMKTLESPVGQQAMDFADALFRNIMPDGRNTLEVLHREGMIQKVPTNQVAIQPNPKSSVRLDELNDILNEMAKGEVATRRLAELDAGAGSTGKQNAVRRVKEGREVGQPSNTLAKPMETIDQTGFLSDADLAAQRLAQADKMKASAQQLLVEAERLTKEAAELNPTVKVKRSNGAKTKVKAH